MARIVRGAMQGVDKPRGPARVIHPSPASDNMGINIGKLEDILKGHARPHFCIVRSLGGIGDVLMTTPLARGLKRKWPGCVVTYATDMDYMDGSLPEILKYNPYIDEVVPHQVVRGKRFDAITNVTSTGVAHEKPGNPPINRVDLFSHGSGIPLFGEKLPIYVVTEEEKQWAQLFLSKYIRRDRGEQNITWIGIQAHSNAERRDWPDENVRLLASRLANTPGIKVMVFDKEPKNPWNIANVIPVINFKIRQVAALIDAVDLMVCHDSGLLHIAGALEKRIVSIFGSSDPRARINYYKNAIAIENKELQCLHCWYAPCQFAYACMKSVSVEEVYSNVINHLKTRVIKETPVYISSPNTETMVLRRDFGGIGDMITITPAIRGLKERFRDKKLHLMIPDQYKDIFLNNPFVDQVIPVNNAIYSSYEFKFDISDVCARYESTRVQEKMSVDKGRITIFCEATGTKPTRYKPQLFISKEERKWAERFINPHNRYKIVATAIRSAENYRNWPIELYKEVFQYFEDKGVKFLILDKERIWDFPYNNIIDAGGFTFRKYISLVNQSNMVLTPDTSLLHVAGALDKPTIALFGPIDYRVRCDVYSKVKVLYDTSLDCIPCWRNCVIPCKINNSLDESVCMQNIKPQQVINAIKEYL